MPSDPATPDPDAEVTSLDLTKDEPAAGQPITEFGEAEEIQERAYDPRPTEDQARKYIAYALIGLLFFVCIATILGVMTGWLTEAEATALLQLILSPVVALVSAATGFYYGTKSNIGGGS